MTAALDAAVAHGFTPMTTPTLVTPQVMGGTGFLGAHSDEIYYLPTDDLYLTGTSEVALAGYHADEILDLTAGPRRYMGWSTCYRREAGAAGKDTRGIIRVHQFNKAEMFSYCRPEDAEAEHARLLAMEEEMLALVELPYRVIDTAAGDLGSSALASSTARPGCPPRTAGWRSPPPPTAPPTRPAAWPCASARREDLAGGHPQRHPGHHPLDGRHPGKPPDARRRGARARGPAPLSGRSRDHRARCLRRPARERLRRRLGARERPSGPRLHGGSPRCRLDWAAARRSRCRP